MALLDTSITVNQACTGPVAGNRWWSVWFAGAAVPGSPNLQVEEVAKNLLGGSAYWARQQEVHDWIQAAVEGSEQEHCFIGSVHQSGPGAVCVVDLRVDVETAEDVVGDEADGEEEEDKKGLLGCPVILECVGKIRMLSEILLQLEGNLDIGDDQGEEDQPE